MNIINKASISSLDSKIIIPTKTEIKDQQSAKIVDLSLSINNTENDSINIKKDQTINGIVIKNENGTQTLQLENGKTIEIKLPAELDVKVLDKVSIQIVDSKVVDIQVKDLATALNINKADFIKLVQALELNHGLKQLFEEKFELSNSSFSGSDNSVKINLLNLLSLKAKPMDPFAEFAKIINALKQIDPSALAKIDINNLHVIIDTQTAIRNLAAVNDVEFSDNSLKALIKAVIQATESERNQFDLKVVKQENLNSVQTVLNDKIKLDLNLNKPEEILSKFITLNVDKNDLKSLNPTPSDRFLTTDTNNTVKSININADTFKNLLSFIKSEFKQTIVNHANQNNIPVMDNTKVSNLNNLKQNIVNDSSIANNNQSVMPKVELTAIVQASNKISVPSLDNLTIKLPIALTNNPVNSTINFSIEHNIRTNQPEILIKANNQTISLENIDLELNSKAVNNYVNNMLQQSNVSLLNSNKILLKTPSMFEIVLTVKNNLANANDVKFILNENNKITLQTPNNLNTNLNIESAKSQIAEAAIPNLAKSFAPQMALMLTSFIINNQQAATKQVDKDSDIFTILLESIPESHQPKLQASSNNADGFKYFTFPYYQEDDILKDGQLTYQKSKNEDDKEVHNIALKVEFSNLGEVMLKIKTIDKSINLNILTKTQLKDEDVRVLGQICQQAIEKSGFLGTVSIKKSESLNMPLLNNTKMVYSGINLEV